MKILRLDHFVLTTKDLNACLNFYSKILGMELVFESGRYALKFGEQKINIHSRKAEFLPAAKNPQIGALDICLVVKEPLENIQRELQRKNIATETAIVKRQGALGEIQSLYLRDPDGNLIELCNYVAGD